MFLYTKYKSSLDSIYLMDFHLGWTVSISLNRRPVSEEKTNKGMELIERCTRAAWEKDACMLNFRFSDGVQSSLKKDGSNLIPL
ncbi:unnamed protein product [Brassica oleracea]